MNSCIKKTLELPLKNVGHFTPIFNSLLVPVGNCQSVLWCSNCADVGRINHVCVEEVSFLWCEITWDE